MAAYRVVALENTPADRERVRALFARHRGGEFVVTRGRVHRADEVEAFVAEDASTGEAHGFVTVRYFPEADEGEIVSLDSLLPGQGIGTALLAAATGAIAEAGYARAVLVTTNDNLPALRFCQKRGFRLVAVHLGAVDTARKRFKPSIPLWGHDYLPLRDEWELEHRFENE
jgi:GNAT superfamily N-acetyltransferase